MDSHYGDVIMEALMTVGLIVYFLIYAIILGIIIKIPWRGLTRGQFISRTIAMVILISISAIVMIKLQGGM